eukprot:257493-Chlamydomonas_euryale.AAC.12
MKHAVKGGQLQCVVGQKEYRCKLAADCYAFAIHVLFSCVQNDTTSDKVCLTVLPHLAEARKTTPWFCTTAHHSDLSTFRKAQTAHIFTWPDDHPFLNSALSTIQLLHVHPAAASQATRSLRHTNGLKGGSPCQSARWIVGHPL